MGSGETVVRPGGTWAARRAFPDSRHRKRRVAGLQRTWTTPSQTLGPTRAVGPRGAGRQGRSYLSESVSGDLLTERYLRDQCRSQEGTSRAGPSEEQHREEVTRRLGPAPFRVVVPCIGSSTVGVDSDRKQQTKGGSLRPVSIGLGRRFKRFQEGGVRAGSS